MGWLLRPARSTGRLSGTRSYPNTRFRVSKPRTWSNKRAVLGDRASLANIIAESSNRTNHNPTTVAPQDIGEPPNPDLCWHGIDLSHAHHRLTVCRKGHERCTKAYLPRPDVASDEILLLDVHRSCLVKRHSNCSYITLSYVWGGVAQFQTTQKNLHALQEPGAIWNYYNDISQVIKDAIEVTKVLGEGFLWVDSLSIVQDDPKSKHDQIQRMGRIYHGSLLTLVSLGGSKASDSLDCKDKRTATMTDRENEPEISNYALSAYTLALQSRVLGSVHNERAWTFQERLLSPRCLFFYDPQRSPFFVCRQDFACDMPRKVPNGGGNVLRRVVVPTAHILNPLATYFDDFDKLSDLKKFETFSRYDQLISGYTSRKLSYASDILDAFSGIQEVLAYQKHWKFLCGLPANCFTFSLLWVPTKVAKRRAPFRALRGKIESYPSWSWAGFDGHVDYQILRAYDVAEDIRSSIWVFTYFNGSLQKSPPVHWITPLPEQRESPYWSERLIRTEKTVEAVHPLTVSQSRRIRRQDLKHVLRFSTQCLPASIFSYHSLAQGNIFCYPTDDPVLQVVALGHEDRLRYCGLIYGAKLRGECFGVGNRLISPSDCSLILISELYGMKAYEDAPYLNGGIDESCFPHKPWCVLNVLLVQRMGNFVERLAVGQLHADAWDEAGPDDRMVLLR